MAENNLNNKTVVVKYGGSAMTDGGLKARFIEDLVFLHGKGVKIALVHGGGPEINSFLKELGREPCFVNGLRKTDAATMEVVLMTLCGKVNKELTSRLVRSGLRALGLCGIDCGLLRAVQDKNKDLGFIGCVEEVNSAFIFDLLRGGYFPVISPVALNMSVSSASADFVSAVGALNVNGDIAAAKIAAAVKADEFILMTDVPGILKNAEDAGSLIKKLTLAEIESLKQTGAIRGGMLPKADCAKIAIEGGVGVVRIIDGRAPHSLPAALGSENPAPGTAITR